MIVHMARHADVTTLEGVVNYLMDRADSGPQLEMKQLQAIQEVFKLGEWESRVHPAMGPNHT